MKFHFLSIFPISSSNFNLSCTLIFCSNFLFILNKTKSTTFWDASPLFPFACLMANFIALSVIDSVSFSNHSIADSTALSREVRSILVIAKAIPFSLIGIPSSSIDSSILTASSSVISGVNNPLNRSASANNCSLLFPAYFSLNTSIMSAFSLSIDIFLALFFKICWPKEVKLKNNTPIKTAVPTTRKSVEVISMVSMSTKEGKAK